MIDAAGRPAQGAIVVVVSGTAPTPEVGIRTDADGRFMVALPAGKFHLQASTRTDTGSVDVDGGESSEIVIRLQGTDH